MTVKRKLLNWKTRTAIQQKNTIQASQLTEEDKIQITELKVINQGSKLLPNITIEEVKQTLKEMKNKASRDIQKVIEALKTRR